MRSVTSRLVNGAVAWVLGAVAWVLRATLVLALSLLLARQDALAAQPSASLLMQPPAASVQSERAVPTSDLSAAVRVHRDGGHTLDVWLVVPLSMHWDAIAADDAPPLHEQLKTVSWPPAFGGGGAGRGRVRFERLDPATLKPTPPLRAWRAMRL